MCLGPDLIHGQDVQRGRGRAALRRRGEFAGLAGEVDGAKDLEVAAQLVSYRPIPDDQDRVTESDDLVADDAGMDTAAPV
ncbi:MAG: hypothetical protein ABIP99_05910 [Ilumatobacteraceae bacterium]